MAPRFSKVPVFILAGGLGTRISEETHLRPKPMVEIGDVPILVHLMRWYYSFGFNDFVICGGYRVWEIKRYFLDYAFRQNHLAIDHREVTDAPPTVYGQSLAQEKWRVRVIDTGQDCMTGGRVARAYDETIATFGEIEHFAVTYGDGLCDIDLAKEFDFHFKHGKTGTVLGVPPLSRFGLLDVRGDGEVKSFTEKPKLEGMVNGGFFFFKNEFRKYLENSANCTLELAPLSKLSQDSGLKVYPHRGFWQPMDTLRDKNHLEELWASGKAPWKVGS